MNVPLEEAQRLFSLAQRDQRAFKTLSMHCSVEDFPTAAFHAQQAIEKCLKSILCLLGGNYRRTHDLTELAGRLSDLGESLPIEENTLYRLTPYAVELRYDEVAIALISHDDAAMAVTLMVNYCQQRLASAK